MERRATAIPLCLSVLLCASAAQAGPPGTTLELWVRRAGSYGTGSDPARERPQRVDLTALTAQQVRHKDAQCEGTFEYRGVPLSTLIERYAPPPGADLALLHFQNGMIVPLPFRDKASMGRLDPFVALSMRGEDGNFVVGRFPPLRRHVDGEYADVKRAAFVGNHLVVSDGWHPAMAAAAAGKFSPFRYVDSLYGVEFVKESAYFGQFDVAPEARPGLALFRQTCQFCHGARKVGARFGWDYVQPIELHTYRTTEQRLYYHIRYRVDSAKSGALMPALKHISEEEAGQLWAWMKAIATRPMAPYAP